jgi:hypothetical protein
MRLIALAGLLLLAAAAAPSVWAAAAGTDAVFLIDQSGSMTGEGATRTANDPTGQRFKLLDSQRERLTNSSRAGYTNRVSVIEFGGRNARGQTFRPQVSLQRKQIPPLAPGQPAAEIARLIEGYFNGIGPRFRGDTDIGRAMDLAIDELQHFVDNPPPVEPGGQPGARNRALILITDGAPWAKGTSVADQKDEITRFTAELKNLGIDWYVVFGFEDDSDYLDKGWRDFWESLASRDPVSKSPMVFDVVDDSVVNRASQVLADVFPPHGAVGATVDNVSIPRYLKALRIDLMFDTPNTQLEKGWVNILDPDGQRAPVDQISADGAAVLVSHPKPGVWRLRSPSDPYTITNRDLITYHLEPMGAAGAVSQYTKLRPQFGFEPDARAYLWGLDLADVAFTVEVSSPTGAKQSLPMTYDPGSGEITAAGDIALDEPGTHRLDAVGVIAAADGTPTEIFTGRGQIDVTEATPVQAVFTQPEAGTILTLLFGGTEIDAQVRFRDARTKAPMLPTQVMQPDAAIELGFLPEGMSEVDVRDLSDPVPLTVTDDALTATLPIDFGGARLDLLGGAQTVRLQILPGYPEPWRSEVRFDGVADGQYLLSPPLMLKESWWSLAPYAVALIIMTVALALGWRYLAVPWLIKKSDLHYKRKPRLAYAAPRNPDCGREWPLTGVRALRPSSSQVSLVGGETWRIQGFKVKRRRKAGHTVEVEVQYRPRGAQKGREKIVLTTSNNDGAPPKARKAIKGLPDNEAADFVLFSGMS